MTNLSRKKAKGANASVAKAWRFIPVVIAGFDSKDMPAEISCITIIVKYGFFVSMDASQLRML